MSLLTLILHVRETEAHELESFFFPLPKSCVMLNSKNTNTIAAPQFCALENAFFSPLGLLECTMKSGVQGKIRRP